MGFSAAASGNLNHNRNNSRFGVFGFRATAFRTASCEERAALANQSGGVRQSLAISRSEEASIARHEGAPTDAESVEDGSTDSMNKAESCGIIGNQPTPTRGAYPATGSIFRRFEVPSSMPPNHPKEATCQLLLLPNPDTPPEFQSACLSPMFSLHG